MRAINGFVLIFIFASFQLGDCDVYMHNPRGSNNRLDSSGTNRQNANRVFDSQNNAKGGYNVGEIKYRAWRDERNQYHMNYFMSGPNANVGATYLNIEWTNQHGCGDGDLKCQIVLQYMCQPYNPDEDGKSIPNRKRNGQTESTPRYRRHNPFLTKAQKDNEERYHSSHPHFALQEPWAWYDKCYKRSRNKGLFTADQNLRGQSSIYTRQDAKGTRYGFECPEERDYYPYWHPTDWIDIAVLTDTSQCSFYQRESFNIKPKGECMEKYPRDPSNFRHDSKYNNRAECVSNGGQWIEFSNYLEKAPRYTNQGSCESKGYMWTYAYRSDDFDRHKNEIEKECVVPLKAPDCAPAPHSRPNHLGNGYGITPNTYKWKLPNYPSGEAQKCFLRIRYNISTADPLTDNLQNDPLVMFMNKLPLQLAIDTSQFGRTFQDRSHLFVLEGRGDKVPNDLRVHNLNVRGKRGNIVQVYPAVEYDFVPKRLEVPEGDAIHAQWTGCNTNPGGNDGQGTRQTDRSNLVEMSNAPYSFPVSSGSQMLKSAEFVHNLAGRSTEYKDVEANLASSGLIELADDSTAVNKLDDELNNASPSFPGIVMKIRRGKYYYMCTRNNNFTNRSQKARLIVA